MKQFVLLALLAVGVTACQTTCEETPLYEPINHCGDDCPWKRD